ncbi:nuclear RNA binding protein, putative [Paecilomyces variotii No. 5]|uniref:Nuclear RNA binding protein, putative n=1 Tax=Byssochlamys spectabilis (strain No. 5 / NBRC 109023) TaxID=1356009 RepID=V5FZ57_BYSSN|nr:nuclear RNA binding protein, putative [Paecilomyces variotii No. 5]
MQLQQALMLDSASDSQSDPNSSHKRKHSHVSSSLSYATASSDVSGRFDDAEEELEMEQLAGEDEDDDTTYYGARSAQSSKRRRSNDWPLRSEVVYNEHGLRVHSGEHAATPNRSSPRSRTVGNGGKANGSPCLRYRRSRFIEGSMNDRVSEKPPSIFVRDDEILQGKQVVPNGPAQRNSGIFKFGKAIAAAFNPFGMWENVSDIWKPPQDRPRTQKEIMKERQAQAQKAYAELKKSGYRGTKGNFNQPNGVYPEIADQTWKAIQEKMEYRSSGNHSRNTSASLSTRDDYQPSCNDSRETMPTAGRPDQGASFRNSFQDLRKARSALSIPSIKRRDASPPRGSLDTPSEDSQRHTVHKQQSRKELARQAKLMKKVSNLEDKLERVRRELREMTAESEPPPVPPIPTVAYDKLPPRRFVPGALPSLPSERLLNNQAEPSPEPYVAPAHSIRCVESGNESEHEEAHTRRFFSTPKARRLSKEQKRPVTQDASPLKRKSPDVNRKQSNDISLEEKCQDEGAETDRSTRSTRKKQSARKSKAQKCSQRDSPGAVERKQVEESESKAPNKPKSPKHLALPRTPTPLRRVPNLKKNSPCSKMKKSRAELPCEKMTDEVAEPPRLTESTRSSPQPFYLQSQPLLNPTADPDAVIISPGKGWGFNGEEENIPPVPPVPQELMANAKRDSGCGGLTSIKEPDLSPGDMPFRSLCEEHRVQRKISDNFQWPDEIF